jgi:hypothetical protein
VEGSLLGELHLLGCLLGKLFGVRQRQTLSIFTLKAFASRLPVSTTSSPRCTDLLAVAAFALARV